MFLGKFPTQRNRELFRANREFVGGNHATDILRKPSWRVRFRRTGLPDLTIIPRLDFSNQDVLDYFLIPREYLKSKEMRLDEPKQIAFRASRFISFERLVSALAIELALRCPQK